ncbi:MULTISPECIES: copper resistance system multicopper oxidase [Stenotrophomonas]|uniref:copper resistance system multicopper oxidase n=1 Tax=Stenotrophomonas TaxID=40323 RepID=UPI00201CD8F5|nr:MULTISPECIES: copper resistance system multicopper oxidase [Stenotrophomonas]MBN5026099.1 copper resistance system multicopper oxidase [Stenotrophomonas maltophilia]MDH1275780.1 copper resistance system multicopper oxidase [Stenotrophomonas sp. GD03937]MDH1485064.1 copper resistance system multicopper oxidase [Stenotrophomonas sp. GD03712]UQY95496.1 copper resistance system multicopper oxidase [Stenotrophomonas maltophilia]WON67857.1 copper resistance system multicopper oxidase [Stenotropho
MNTRNPPGPGALPMPSRRLFVQGLAAGGVVAGIAAVGVPQRALAAATATPRLAGAPAVLSDTRLELAIGESLANFTGRTRPAITVNGSLPAPILRWREGQTVDLFVRNTLDRHPTSIHWHGILLPANMDGVPGLSFNGIGPGETYHYHFDLKQSGTYWYHSHSMFQEQAGLYGALIIDPAEPAPYHHDREHVIMLSDWTDMDPGALFRRMKKLAEHDNYYKRTLPDFLRDVKRDGWSAALSDRGMWGRMRMTPTDISDINAHTYTYLMNGTAPAGNWTGLFRSGEKVLLRFINGASMTYFDVRIPGLKMTVVAADGQYIHPVSIDEFRIAPAETYDVLVEPTGQDAFTIFCQDMGRTGFAAGTLAVRHGLQAPIPARDPRPLLTMSDMGHDMGGGHAGHDMSAMMGMDHGSMDHSAHGGGITASKAPKHPASERNNPLVDMQSAATEPKLDDPGIGLRDNGRQVLTYGAMRSLFEDPDGREPSREVELHLTGHMEKFSWSFDGIPFASAEPLRLNYGERMRIVLVNDTMMQHPIHLHGVWSDLENAQGEFQVRKHTIDMPPGTRRSYRVRADALGRWAYHCHLLYHMEAGMMREVRIEE